MTRLILLSAVICFSMIFSMTASASEVVIKCWIAHESAAAPNFLINSDRTLTVQPVGSALNNPPTNSPVTIKSGTLTNVETRSFEGEKPEVSKTETKLYRISETKGKVWLLIKVTADEDMIYPGTVEGLMMGKAAPRDWGQQEVFCKGNFDTLESMASK